MNTKFISIFGNVFRKDAINSVYIEYVNIESGYVIYVSVDGSVIEVAHSQSKTTAAKSRDAIIAAITTSEEIEKIF